MLKFEFQFLNCFTNSFHHFVEVFFRNFYPKQMYISNPTFAIIFKRKTCFQKVPDKLLPAELAFRQLPELGVDRLGL